MANWTDKISNIFGKKEVPKEEPNMSIAPPAPYSGPSWGELAGVQAPVATPPAGGTAPAGVVTPPKNPVTLQLEDEAANMEMYGTAVPTPEQQAAGAITQGSIVSGGIAGPPGWTPQPTAPTPPAPPKEQAGANGATNGGNKSAITDMKGLGESYGVEPMPTYEGLGDEDKALVDSYGAKVKELAPDYDPNYFKELLAQQTSAISSKYAQKAIQEKEDAENSRMSQISGLYSIGVVNPLSSGLASIGTASKKMLDDRLDTLAGLENQEKLLAIEKMYGLQTAEREKTLNYYQGEIDRKKQEADDEYTRQRQQWTDSWQNISSLISLRDSEKKATAEEKKTAQDSLIFGLENFGSGFLEGVDETGLAKMSEAMGYSANTLYNSLEYIKGKNLKGEEMNLKTVNGSLYNVYQDAKGNIKSDLIIKGKGTGTGVGGTDDPLVASVIANPELFNQLTATEKGRIAPALNALGFTAFGKPLSATAVKDITQSETALEGVKELKQIIQDNEEFIGPIAGLAKINPYSKARQVQADIDRVKQRVGKALEGGVLRKEDEDKYKKILAQITDTQETALYKVNQIIVDIEREIEAYKNNYALAGYGVREQLGETLGAEEGLGTDINAIAASNDFDIDSARKYYSDDEIEQQFRDSGWIEETP